MSNLVVRILYKELMPGDLRKIQANSNDSPTGGGARDFRFGAYKKLAPAIKKMFPQVILEKRKRGEAEVELEVFKGVFSWLDKDGNLVEKDSFFEPPTDARPSEGRIVRVPEYECFDPSKIPQGSASNKIILLFIQTDDGRVWPYFAEENSLRSGQWDPRVEKVILGCIDKDRAGNKAVIGYYDLQTQECYCNGN